MRIKNKITNTDPCVLHAYGASHVGPEWDKLKDLSYGVDISIPNDITVISFFFGGKSFVLRDQLESQFIPFINASTPDITLWQDRQKIRLISNVIKKVKTKYVLILDGIDVLLAENIDTIVSKFISMDCKLLYNACVYSHPLSYNIDDILGDKSLGVFSLLNTGAFIGEASFVDLFYKDVMTIYDDVTMPVPHTDGIRVGIKYKNYPEIKIDHNCEIFQTLLGLEYNIEEKELIVLEQQ